MFFGSGTKSLFQLWSINSLKTNFYLFFSTVRTVMLSQLASWCEGRLIGEDVAIERISTDSRKKLDGALFVALRGERFDAHEFVSQAEENGAAALLLSACAAAAPAAPTVAPATATTAPPAVPTATTAPRSGIWWSGRPIRP